MTWAEPGAHDVADGVFRIPLQMPGDGLHAVNVYAVQTADGLALVDGGWRTATALTELESALAQVGETAARIHDVFVTHVHRDHYTLAVELRRRFGSRVHLGRDELPGLHALLELGSNLPLSSLVELRRSGDGALAAEIEELSAAEEFEADGWEKPDTWLEPGPLPIEGRAFEVVATPGHTKGHLVFHDRDEGLLFAGDHLLPRISPSIGFELGEWDLPLGHYLASLELVLARPDARLFPAHGAPGPSAHARATELLEHHELRLHETRVVLGRCRSATASKVAGLLRWTRRRRSYDELDAFNRMIATCETIAHLDVLVARGEAVESPAASGSVFAPA